MPRILFSSKHLWTAFREMRVSVCVCEGGGVLFWCFVPCRMCKIVCLGHSAASKKPSCTVCHALQEEEEGGGSEQRHTVVYTPLPHSSILHQTVASTARMQPRIHHPRLNRLIFSRRGLWESTCFILVLLALPEAPQLFGALWVCRVIFLKRTSNTCMNKRWWDLWRFTAAHWNVKPVIYLFSFIFFAHFVISRQWLTNRLKVFWQNYTCYLFFNFCRGGFFGRDAGRSKGHERGHNTNRNHLSVPHYMQWLSVAGREKKRRDPLPVLSKQYFWQRRATVAFRS